MEAATEISLEVRDCECLRRPATAEGRESAANASRNMCKAMRSSMVPFSAARCDLTGKRTCVCVLLFQAFHCSTLRSYVVKAFVRALCAVIIGFWGLL